MARDKVDVAKRVVDAYNRRDVDGLFAELATPDFEWSEFQVIPEEFRDLGDRVLVLGRIKGRGKGSGAG
jgi:hypothetical protein